MCQKQRKHFLSREKNVSGFLATKKKLCSEVQNFINSSINTPMQDKNIQKIVFNIEPGHTLKKEDDQSQEKRGATPNKKGESV